MAAHKHIDAICIGITLLTLLLTVLFMNGKALGIVAVADGDSGGGMFTANDLDGAWDTAGASVITLSDTGSRVSGNGAYVYGNEVHIVYAGNYVLSGELSDGCVIVEAESGDKVRLMLCGVSIHCEDGAALRVEQAEKVFMTLHEGTENALSSGSSYSEDAVSGGVDGTVYSRDDLTVNGSGSLYVTAEYRHGIVCNDDLVIAGGMVNVTAAQDAIHANDSARIREADITLSAGDDGITVSNDEETSFIYVESGNITIPSCYEGLEAVQITVAGGRIDIDPTDDGINANGYGGNSVINITGGDITVTDDNGRDADGIDSNRDIYISGGRLFVSVSDSGGSCAIDYGSEYGGKCVISGGTVLACGSSGMAEGFDSSSTQGFLMQTVSASAGTEVTLRDAVGNELISETVPCSFSSVLVSAPGMKVGDTCTLTVGDTETELTVDNSPASGGFGGFSGGQRPGHGGFGKGMFGGETPGEPSGDPAGEPVGGETISGVSTQSAPAVSLLSSADSGSRGEFAPGEMPEFSQSGDEGGFRDRSDLPQGGGNFGTRPGGGNFRDPGMTTQGQDPAAQASGAGEPIPARSLVLLGVSVAVLLVGCVAAALYKRRG